RALHDALPILWTTVPSGSITKKRTPCCTWSSPSGGGCNGLLKSSIEIFSISSNSYPDKKVQESKSASCSSQYSFSTSGVSLSGSTDKESNLTLSTPSSSNCA